MHPELGVTGHHVEIIVSMQDRHVGADGDGGDEAIDELPDRLSLAAAMTMDASRLVIVRRCGGKDGGSRQKPSESMQMLFVASSCEDRHPNRIANGYVFAEQLIDSIADR